MRRFTLVLLLVMVPSICVANPDGPVGSIVLDPNVSFTDKGGGNTDHNSVVGLDVLIPAGSYGTVRFGVEGGNLEIDRDRNRVRFIFSLRLYLPITKGANDKLKNWDQRR